MHRDDIKKERDAIVAELNIGNLTREQQDELFEQLGELAFKKTVVAVLELMDESDRGKFEEYLVSGDQASLETLLAEKVGTERMAELSRQEIWNVIQDHKKTVAELAATEGE